MSSYNELPDIEIIRQRLNYDPKSGIILWKSRPEEDFKLKSHWFSWQNNYANKRAGYIRICEDGQKYILIGILGVQYRAHRLVWKLIYNEDPKDLLDHIDGDGLNNAIENLRKANDHLNGGNSKISKNNTTGFKGVVWEARRNKYNANIMVNRKRIFLGRFDCPKKAHEAYCVAAVKYFGEFARFK